MKQKPYYKLYSGVWLVRAGEPLPFTCRSLRAFLWPGTGYTVYFTEVDYCPDTHPSNLVYFQMLDPAYNIETAVVPWRWLDARDICTVGKLVLDKVGTPVGFFVGPAEDDQLEVSLHPRGGEVLPPICCYGTKRYKGWGADNSCMECV